MINKAEQVLAELIKRSLFGLSADFPDDVVWEDVFAEAQAHAVVALAYPALPENIAASWKTAAAQSKAHFMRALYEQTDLCSLLSSAGVPFVIIKGAAAAAYYPRPIERSVGDVDVFIGEENFDAALSLLSGNGYEFRADYGDGREHVFAKDGVTFELHKRYSDEGHDIEPMIVDGMKRARTVSLYGDAFPALSTPENGLLILDHIRHHIIGGIGLRQIIDFMMFIASEPDEKNFESECLPLFEKARLANLARIIAKTCKKYFGLPVEASWCEGADEKTCDEFMEMIFSSGNFGVKAPYEYHPMEAFTISVKKHGLFRTLQTAGVANCKAFQKHKLLRPFAWLYQSFRYARKGLIAVFRKEKLVEGVSKGKEKSDFYERLGVL